MSHTAPVPTHNSPLPEIINTPPDGTLATAIDELPSTHRNRQSLRFTLGLALVVDFLWVRTSA